MKEINLSEAVTLALPLLQWCVTHEKEFQDGFFIDISGIRVVKQDILIRKEEE